MSEEDKKSISLSELMHEFSLKVLANGDKVANTLISSADLMRPGLPLAGYYKHFRVTRIQIMGSMEVSYMNSLESEERRESCFKFCEKKVPAIILCRNLPAPPELMQAVEEYEIPLLQSDMATSEFSSQLNSYLINSFAKHYNMHANLVEVYGLGILITGDSGVGKSEITLELIKRGHRMVADDVVMLKRTGSSGLSGSPPEYLRNKIVIRGLGILDAGLLFGLSSVKLEENIDLHLHLEEWDGGKSYKQLGDFEEENLYGVNVKKVTIPVRPGRNISVIIEAAALSRRLQMLGLESNHDFLEQVLPDPDD